MAPTSKSRDPNANGSDDAEINLLRRYRDEGDLAAREELVESLMPWVRRVASRYANRGQDIDDLIQVGSLGLFKAIDRFDFDRGVRLTTFAEPNVTGEIKRYFRDHSWSIKPPRDLQELNAEVMTATDVLASELQRSPRIEELADYLGTNADSVLEAIHAGASYDSAPLLVSTEGDEPLLESPALAVEDEAIERFELRQSIGSGMRALDQRHKEIIHMRFYEGLTQAEIADRVGVSQMQVSRLLRAALKLVRSDLSEPESSRESESSK
ncbi:MAG: SigB/SigF/SigG family RNA polymerase sigma factor [Solirubrobacterales bacterium]